MLFSSLLLISKICYVLKILTQFHFAEYCSGVSNLPISANLCAFSKFFLFGLFHRVQANTHEPCSWNSGQSRRKRFPTCSFMAFVRFHFKYNLKLAALQPVFTSPKPFQAHRVFSVSCWHIWLFCLFKRIFFFISTQIPLQLGVFRASRFKAAGMLVSVVEVEGRPLCIFISELTFKLYEQHMQIFSVINAINSICIRHGFR